MGFKQNIYVFVAIFALYGIYAAATEGVSKAWISNISHEKDTATAIGTYSAFQSFFTMLASSMAGLIWYQFGADTAFLVTAFASILIGLYFIFMTTEKV
jgi:MFS family permease